MKNEAIDNILVRLDAIESCHSRLEKEVTDALVSLQVMLPDLGGTIPIGAEEAEGELATGTSAVSMRLGAILLQSRNILEAARAAREDVASLQFGGAQ